jgi:hypothetical protein
MLLGLRRTHLPLPVAVISPRRYCKNKRESSGNLNMMSALTHVLIDTLRSLAVMVAAFMASVLHMDGDKADAYAAFVCSTLTFFSTVPLIRGLWQKGVKLRRLGRGSTMMESLTDVDL